MDKSKRFTGVYSNKKKNGDISYYIHYRDESGKLVLKKVGNKSAGITEVYCKQQRDAIINSVRLGLDAPHLAQKKKDIITLDEIASNYFTAKEGKSNTQHEQNRYNNHIKEVFGAKDISHITTEEIEEFRKKKLKGTSKIKALSVKTVNNISDLISVIYNHSIKRNKITIQNPVTNIEKEDPDNERERYLTTEEVQDVLTAVQCDNVKEGKTLLLFCLLSFSTGARLNSVLNIQKKDINLQDKTIMLKDFKIKKEGKTRYQGYIKKELYTILKDKLPNLNTHDYIVSIDDGQKMKIAQMRDRLQPILNKLFNEGLDTKDAKNRVVIHTFRHTFASHLAKANTPIYTIMKLMNHQDIKSTLRYAKLSSDVGQEMVLELYEI